ncbi:MAG TPA: UbiA-like polyprenyltransferase, partial [Spirochaetales bacterium]|nr:UbiA-like polyprenyltransferase [Spirochaetales bacterium]
MASEQAPRAARARGGLTLGLLSDIGEAVIIRHTLFSLPFALIAILLETGGKPKLLDVVLILIAAAAARNAANALNRIIDAKIDANNPRTAGRHLPSGKLKAGQLWAFTAIMLALLVSCAWLLDPLCVLLLPLAGVMVFGYSFTKRYTWLCHFWLGLTCAAAPMGALIAVSGRIEFRFFVLAGAVAAWVAGFDIIYARGDLDLDRRQGIHS